MGVAQAEKSYLRALEINELCAHAWQGLSEVFQTTNDYPKAIPVLQKLVRHRGSVGLWVLALESCDKP